MAAHRTLEPEAVLAMRSAAVAGISAAALARRYGIGCTAAERIIRGETYRDIGGPTIAATPRPDALPDESVIAIRERRADGETVAEIARDFAITRQACDRIVRGVTYHETGGPITASGGQAQSAQRIAVLAAAILERRDGPFEIEEIAEVMGVSRNAAEKRVDRLVELEYARKAIFPGMFELTPDGWAYARKLVEEGERNRKEQEEKEADQ